VSVHVVSFSYSHSAPKLLYQIYSELMLPIPVELEHLRTPEEAEQSVPMPSISASSSHSMLSTSIRSGELRPDIGQPRLVGIELNVCLN
jgi:hypothetical protein